MPTLFLVVTGLGRVPILRHGTPEQIKKYVTPTCTGEQKLCFAITEPNAGTNSFAMTTFAARNAKGGWTLNGQKVFISGARDADTMIGTSAGSMVAGRNAWLERTRTWIGKTPSSVGPIQLRS